MDLHKIMYDDTPLNDDSFSIKVPPGSTVVPGPRPGTFSIIPPDEGEIQTVDYVREWAEREATRLARERERQIRMELLAGEPINGDVLDYRVEFIDGAGVAVCCAHHPPIPQEYYRGKPIPASARIESRFHAVELRPIPWDNYRGFGVCHDQKVIYVTRERSFRPRGGEHVEIQGPPIQPKTCSFCQATGLEVFFESKRDKKIACQKCFDERSAQYLAKEVPE